jgi:hypothetical protein
MTMVMVTTSTTITATSNGLPPSLWSRWCPQGDVLGIKRGCSPRPIDDEKLQRAQNSLAAVAAYDAAWLTWRSVGSATLHLNTPPIAMLNVASWRAGVRADEAAHLSIAARCPRWAANPIPFHIYNHDPDAPTGQNQLVQPRLTSEI